MKKKNNTIYFDHSKRENYLSELSISVLRRNIAETYSRFESRLIAKRY